jgi:hypothetical protein
MSTKNELIQAAGRIDEISKRASSAFLGGESFEKALVVAQSIGELKAALTDEVMRPIMELMNTPLGFMTDQDPKRPSTNNPKPEPYTVEIVRDCFIEGRLRGFFPVGNEMNIIAGRFYGALAGFERIVRNHPKVTDFKDTYEVPRRAGSGDAEGALVKCRAEWKQDRVKQTLEREFAVRINRGMGTDAIVGKAKRKLFAAVLSRLTGVVTPEGDATDVEHLKSANPPAPGAATAEDLFSKNGGAKKDK